MDSLETCRVNVKVSNMDEALEFYKDVLGLVLINRYEDHYAEVQAPDLLIGLHLNSEGTVKGNNISIGFGVTEFDETVSDLKSKGIDLRIENEGWVRLAYFKDPDHNHLYLAERKNK